MDELQEITEDFLIEAFEMIEQLDYDLVELENNPEDLDLLNRIFRVAHTIKGSGSFLNFNILTKLTHNMEDVLNKARKGELKIPPDIMDVELESVDLMKTLLGSIRDSGSDSGSGVDIEPCIGRLKKISNEGEDESEEVSPSPQAENDTSPQPAQESAQATAKAETQAQPQEEPDYSSMSAEEVEAEIERLLKQKQEEDKIKREERKKMGIVDDIQAPKEISDVPPKNAQSDSESKADSKAQDESSTKAESTESKKSSEQPSKKDDNKAPSSVIEQTVRVDVKRLDHLMNLIGELVLGKNRLMRIYGDVEERYDGEKFLEELNQVVSSISMVTTDLQLAVMKTRMLPIGKVFNKFPRMVRDLSRELGKNIELTISGEETELDKSIVEEIGDPLVHIIRNSCDHGIESAEDRAVLKKSETGKINLRAYNEGNHIVIEISDDGKGLDAEAIKNKALKNGIISKKEAEVMSDKGAFNIIFKAGFSMASKVTNVSGRGVGMDVVRTNIEKLNGIIEIDSEVGVGTTIKLKISLTLAIIQALLVGVQEEYYAIPLSSVLETVLISRDEIYSVDGKSVLRLRDEVLSLVKLSDIFNVETTVSTPNDVYVVIIGLADAKLGVIVDYLIGQEEVVIKSLGYYLRSEERRVG